MAKKCPKCGHNQFIVTAHVTQTWRVDENGEFDEEITSCDQVTHEPDDDDVWACTNCGYEAAGSEFNTN